MATNDACFVKVSRVVEETCNIDVRDISGVSKHEKEAHTTIELRDGQRVSVTDDPVSVGNAVLDAQTWLAGAGTIKAD